MANVGRDLHIPLIALRGNTEIEMYGRMLGLRGLVVGRGMSLISAGPSYRPQ